jgi:YD repeat-containing protein
MILNRLLPILLIFSLNSHADQIAPAKFRFADSTAGSWTWFDSLEAAAESYAKNFCAETDPWTWNSNCYFKDLYAGLESTGLVTGWAGDFYFTINYYDGSPSWSVGPFPGLGGWGQTLCPQQFLFDKRGFCFLPDDVALRSDQGAKCTKGSCCVGNPIDVGSHTKIQVDQDASPPPGHLLNYQRSYSSANRVSGVGWFGSMWRSDLDVSVAAMMSVPILTEDETLLFGLTGAAPSWYTGASSTGTSSLLVNPYSPTTSSIIFSRPDGSMRRLFGSRVRWSDDDTLSASGNEAGYILRDTKLGRIEAYGLDERLLSITSYAGKSVKLDFGSDADRRIKITDQFGRTSILQYTSDRVVKQLSLPDGEVVSFGYGDLTVPVNPPYTVKILSSATYSNSLTKRYVFDEVEFTENSYVNGLLTGAYEESPSAGAVRTGTFNFRFDGRVKSTEQAGGVARYTITSGFPYQSSVLQDPLGTSRTLGFSVVLGQGSATGVSQPGGSGCGPSGSAISYDARGNRVSLTDFSNRKTCYAYDTVANAQKNLETVRAEGFEGAAACPVDLAAYVVPSTLAADKPQRKISTLWHPLWRLASRVAEPKLITTSVYNGQPDPSNGNQPLSCAPNNALLPDGQPIVVLCKRIEQPTQDATGSNGLGAASDGPPRSWSYTYNRFGQKLTEVDPRGKTTQWDYFNDTNADHTVGDLRSTTNAAGQTSRYSRYDKAGRLLTMSDANSVVSQYSYTPRGWLKSASVNPPAGGGASEVTGYDHYPTGLLKLATLPDGSTLKYDYDDAHRLTDITDSAGNTVHYTLDEMGNRKGEELKDPGGTLARSITRIFDDLNRLQNVTGAMQ